MAIIKKIIVVYFTLFLPTQAHIFEAEKWVSSDSKQTISLLGDYHLAENKENQVNDTQQDIVIEVAKRLNAALILEDGKTDIVAFKKDPLHYDRNTYCEFVIDNPTKTTLLLGFTQRCQEEGITVNNVEFRFPDLLTSTQLLMQKLEQVKQKISSYDDGPVLNSYYRAKLQELYDFVEKPCKKLFAQLKQSGANLTLTEPTIRYHHSYNRALDYLWEQNRLCLRDDTKLNKIHYIITGLEAKLLDLEILHAIAEQKNCPHIIICAGASHLNSIKPALEVLGFTRTHTNNPAEQTCSLNGTYIEPQAINVENTLNAFYKNERITSQNQEVPSTDFSSIIVGALLLLVGIAGSIAVIRNLKL